MRWMQIYVLCEQMNYTSEHNDGRSIDDHLLYQIQTMIVIWLTQSWFDTHTSIDFEISKNNECRAQK